ncbi:MAG: tetratricopeptide repeat protein [Saprospiraceae bacterium]
MRHYVIIYFSIFFNILLLNAQQTAEEWYAKGVEASSHAQKITYFSKAIKLNPDFVEAYNARANVHFAMGMVHEAIQDFSQSIRIDPDRVFTYYSRASCLLALGDYGAAAEDFAKVIGLQPNHVYAMSGRGCALMLQGQHEAAVNVLNETLALDETVQSAVKCRAQSLKKLGRPVPTMVSNKGVPSTEKPKSVAAPDAESSTKFILKEATGMREGPTHTSRTLLRFEAGSQVELVEKTDEFWWKVRYKGKVGYAKAAMLAGIGE